VPYVYLLSTKARATPTTIVSTTFNGESTKIKFEYGKAAVSSELAELLIARRIASPSIKDWGSVPSANDISLAPVGTLEAAAIFSTV
jgi:hypothetical protein